MSCELVFGISMDQFIFQYRSMFFRLHCFDNSVYPYSECSHALSLVLFANSMLLKIFYYSYYGSRRLDSISSPESMIFVFSFDFNSPNFSLVCVCANVTNTVCFFMALASFSSILQFNCFIFLVSFFFVKYTPSPTLPFYLNGFSYRK